MMKESTKQAIKRAKKGDMEAFAEAFEALRPTVFAIAFRLVGGNDADDVVMETFLKAWKAIPNYNEHSSLKTWLYRITHNAAMDCLRKKGRQQSKFLSENDPENTSLHNLSDSNQKSPASALVKTEMKQLVQEALSMLDEDHRRVIWLRYADGLAYKEIAAATGITMGTVMSRIFNGKKKLQKLVASLEKRGNKEA